MTKVDGKSGSNIQHGNTSIRSTDERMQEILSGPGTEKEKLAKLENELKALMEANPKYEQDKQDLEAEKRQIQNQLKDPKSPYGKLSPAGRRKLEEHFIEKPAKPGEPGVINRVYEYGGRIKDKAVAIKEDLNVNLKMREIEEQKKLQKSYSQFTPQYYQEKMKAVKNQIDWLKNEIELHLPAPSGGPFNPPPIHPANPLGGMRLPSNTSPDYANRLHKTLQAKTEELAKLEAEYNQKFPMRPSGPMQQG